MTDLVKDALSSTAPNLHMLGNGAGYSKRKVVFEGVILDQDFFQLQIMLECKDLLV